MNSDKEKALKYIKTAKGQLEGIEKMIESGRYCMDISNQLLASTALIKKAHKHILKQHLNHCVHNAMNSDDIAERNSKLEEISLLLDKLTGGN